MAKKQRSVRKREVQAWGERRQTVDTTQLALAYYLLALQRIKARPTAVVAQHQEGRQAS